jgi:hypothetical protein
VQIDYENTEAGPVLMVRKPGEGDALRRWIVDKEFDLKIMCHELLGDLGEWTPAPPVRLADGPISSTSSSQIFRCQRSRV